MIKRVFCNECSKKGINNKWRGAKVIEYEPFNISQTYVYNSFFCCGCENIKPVLDAFLISYEEIDYYK